MPAKTTAPDRLTAEVRRELPDAAYGIPETHEFPLANTAHVRVAESCFCYASNDRRVALAHRIPARARELGVEVRSHTVCEWAAKAK